MNSVDPMLAYYDGHRDELLAEAEQERLAAQLPRRGESLRRKVAEACFQLASWLDGPVRYVRRSESGDEDWVAPWASV
jgi:hypothetical protein